MKNSWVKKALTLGLIAGIFSISGQAGFALEEETQKKELPPVSVPGVENGVKGYWVITVTEYYKKKAIIKPAGSVGRWDQDIQNLMGGVMGVDTPMTTQQLKAIYDGYGLAAGNDPTGANGKAFDWESKKEQIKADLNTLKTLASGSPADLLASMDPKVMSNALEKAVTGRISDSLADAAATLKPIPGSDTKYYPWKVTVSSKDVPGTKFEICPIHKEFHQAVFAGRLHQYAHWQMPDVDYGPYEQVVTPTWLNSNYNGNPNPPYPFTNGNAQRSNYPSDAAWLDAINSKWIYGPGARFNTSTFSWITNFNKLVNTVHVIEDENRYANTPDKLHVLDIINSNGIDKSQFDATTLKNFESMSVKDLLAGNPTQFKALMQAPEIESALSIARFQMMTDLLSKGLTTGNIAMNTTLNTLHGPVTLNESFGFGSADRAKDLGTWLVNANYHTYSPIVLDLNHDGKIGVTGSSTAQRRMKNNPFVARGSVNFDIQGIGKKLNVEWLDGSGDGFLVDDSNGRFTLAASNSVEVDGNVLFGDAIGYTHGYHKLAVKKVVENLASVANLSEGLDWPALMAKKGVLKGSVLHSLKVWTDNNHDAKPQVDEVKSLESLGITEIGTVPTTTKNKSGEYVIQSYFIQNGQRHLTEDVWFAANPNQNAK